MEWTQRIFPVTAEFWLSGNLGVLLWFWHFRAEGLDEFIKYVVVYVKLNYFFNSVECG